MKGNFADFQQIYNQARIEGFRLALHCAEVKNDFEILTMLEFMTSNDRIGHGTFIEGEF
jgi:adenosine deaminase